MNDVLFVYGTLAPGEPSWALLERHVTGTRASAVPGRLYDTGRGYPGAVFADGPELVTGWCCTLRDAPLDALDAFEGDEYERVTVRCTDGTEAFAYHWAAALEGLTRVPDGNWFAHR